METKINTSKISNMIAAEDYINAQAQKHFGYNTRQCPRAPQHLKDQILKFKRDLLEKEFSRFSATRLYKMCMGEVQPTGQYHYETCWNR